jgi:hypothetical protein
MVEADAASPTGGRPSADSRAVPFADIDHAADAHAAVGTPSSAAASDPSNEVKLPWYRSRWCRVLTVRICMRLSMIGLIIGLGFVFSFRGAVNEYADWIAHFDPDFIAVLLFTIFATVFASGAPGECAPSAMRSCVR